MKRALITVSVAVGVVIVVVASLLAATFMGRKSLSDDFQIAGGQIVVDGGSAVAILPIGGGKVALVDAGNDADGTAILSELSRLGLNSDAVAAILLTHGHPDHIGAIRRFPAATVMAMEHEVGLIEGREGARGPLPRWFPIRSTGISVARRLRDGETFMVGDAEVRAFAVPGHTAGSAAYLVRGVLFVGDSADADSDGKLQGAPWIFSDSPEQNRQSLAMLGRRLHEASLRVDTIVPAHSGALTDGLTQLDVFVKTLR